MFMSTNVLTVACGATVLPSALISGSMLQCTRVAIIGVCQQM
jgi:hypothetical protein